MGKLTFATPWLAGLALLAFASCGTDSGSSNPQAPQNRAAENIVAPEFNEDSAYAYVAQQVAFGPRVPNTETHEECAAWLARELARHGAQVTVQEGRARAFDGTILNMKNIVGSFHPESRDRVLLFAHWDTRPFADKDSLRQREPIDGANDGASGVGVLLEIARQLGQIPADIGVDIAFFDAEDYGRPEWLPSSQNGYKDWCLGSQFWAANPHRPGYRARFGILLDMVGARDAVFHQEGTSLRLAPHVVRKVWKRASDLGFGGRFSSRSTPQTIDDNLFVSELAGIPSANIVDYRMNVRPMGYGPFHHTHADNMDIIDPQTLDVVGTTVLSVVYNP
ncbi:MAG: M28 family peptidase [Flavobacteriales bacterium]